MSLLRWRIKNKTTMEEESEQMILKSIARWSQSDEAKKEKSDAKDYLLQVFQRKFPNSNLIGESSSSSRMSRVSNV